MAFFWKSILLERYIESTESHNQLDEGNGKTYLRKGTLFIHSYYFNYLPCLKKGCKIEYAEVFINVTKMYMKFTQGTYLTD